MASTRRVYGLAMLRWWWCWAHRHGHRSRRAGGRLHKVFITDVRTQKLELAGKYPGITPVDVREKNIAEVVGAATERWGADIVFEAGGNPRAIQGVFDSLCPGGCVVLSACRPPKSARYRRGAGEGSAY